MANGQFLSLFALTGRTFVVVALLARLPLAMSQLGTLLLVASVTGSYGAGGASAGALAIANALGAPVAGALTDRYGQRWILLIQSLVGGAGLVALVALSHTDVSWTVLAVTAAVSGLFLPQIGTMARVRWRGLGERREADRDAVINTAFSYEGAADEASFVLGPALVGLLAAAIDPRGALLLAAGMIWVFGVWFAVHRTVALALPSGEQIAVAGGKLLNAPFILLLAMLLVVGLVFGSVQTGSAVLATDAGQPGLTGLLHALLGVGSVTAGLLLPRLPAKYRLEDRLVVFAGGLFVLALPLLFVGSITMLIPGLLVLGVCIAPYMITIFTLAERVVPAHRLGAAMTALAAITGLGYALGSSIAGRLADWGGHTPAYAVTAAAGLLALLLTTLGRSALRRAQATARDSADIVDPNAALLPA
ncbi:MFS transporter [Janibacter sp. GXQ6167]|uniref:MFS transporter n=1 Tax=Janibacter sp. GXQ6167 TaxID=3240791 RepID=UPI003524EAC6